jgi:hypothetical protein
MVAGSVPMPRRISAGGAGISSVSKMVALAMRHPAPPYTIFMSDKGHYPT